MPRLGDGNLGSAGERYGHSGTDRALGLTWVEGEAPLQPRRVRIFHVTGEVPLPSRALKLMWIEGEVSDFGRAAKVFWVEGEVPNPGGVSFGGIVGESKLLASLTQAALTLELAGGIQVAGQEVFEATQGDTRPIRALLKDEDGNLPDLTGSVVLFLLGDGNGSLLVSGAATGFSPPLVDADGEQYNVEYGFAAADLDRAPGSYRGQFKVTLIDGTVLHFPSGGKWVKIKLGKVIS